MLCYKLTSKEKVPQGNQTISKLPPLLSDYAKEADIEIRLSIQLLITSAWRYRRTLVVLGVAAVARALASCSSLRHPPCSAGTPPWWNPLAR